MKPPANGSRVRRRFGLTVVLKGHRTAGLHAGRRIYQHNGEPRMATGGMGDVLTGLIAALLGQGHDRL